MKVVVIGAGAAGLTAAASFVKNGHQVTVIDHNSVSGGVLRGWQANGFTWDLGQLLVEGMGENEPIGDVLINLGIFDQVKTILDERRYVFPDFDLQHPVEYQGVKWRLNRLAEIFPQDSRGLKLYWKDYLRFNRFMTVVRNMNKATGNQALVEKLKFIFAALPFLKKRDLNADQLMKVYFSSEKLQAVFISILADFFTPPSQFQGLGVFALNPEPSFEKRIPKQLKPGIEQLYHYSILGGTRSLVDALENFIRSNHGEIRLGEDVTKVIVKDGKVNGVEINHQETLEADIVVASGGADELFFDLIGKENLPEGLAEKVTALPLMDSVFMVHLGLDIDPKPFVGGSCTYYYRTYDIEGSIQEGKQGIYHQGKHGFVVHVPTNHSPEMAPASLYAMTIYTISPDTLKEGSWAETKEDYAKKLIEYMEDYFPGLEDHITCQVIFTAEEFKEICFTKHHAFGGLAPIMGKDGISHETPIKGLWFVGQQSQSGGGLGAVIPAAYRTAEKISKWYDLEKNEEMDQEPDK